MEAQYVQKRGPTLSRQLLLSESRYRTPQESFVDQSGRLRLNQFPSFLAPTNYLLTLKPRTYVVNRARWDIVEDRNDLFNNFLGAQGAISRTQDRKHHSRGSRFACLDPYPIWSSIHWHRRLLRAGNIGWRRGPFCHTIHSQHSAKWFGKSHVSALKKRLALLGLLIQLNQAASRLHLRAKKVVIHLCL